MTTAACHYPQADLRLQRVQHRLVDVVAGNNSQLRQVHPELGARLLNNVEGEPTRLWRKEAAAGDEPPQTACALPRTGTPSRQSPGGYPQPAGTSHESAPRPDQQSTQRRYLVAQVVQCQRHSEEVGDAASERVVGVHQRKEARREGLSKRDEGGELTLVGFGRQLASVLQHNVNEVDILAGDLGRQELRLRQAHQLSPPQPPTNGVRVPQPAATLTDRASSPV